jgi:hypothetical protein
LSCTRSARAGAAATKNMARTISSLDTTVPAQ